MIGSLKALSKYISVINKERFSPHSSIQSVVTLVACPFLTSFVDDTTWAQLGADNQLSFLHWRLVMGVLSNHPGKESDQ